MLREWFHDDLFRIVDVVHDQAKQIFASFENQHIQGVFVFEKTFARKRCSRKHAVQIYKGNEGASQTQCKPTIHVLHDIAAVSRGNSYNL